MKFISTIVCLGAIATASVQTNPLLLEAAPYILAIGLYLIGCGFSLLALIDADYYFMYWSGFNAVINNRGFPRPKPRDRGTTAAWTVLILLSWFGLAGALLVKTYLVHRLRRVDKTVTQEEIP